MKAFFFTLATTLIAFASNIQAENVVWSGEIAANGKPTPLISLVLNHKYQIEVSGVINTGKWREQGVPLGEDACFDFSDKTSPSKNDLLRNSMDVSICDGTYQPSHVYKSKPFTAKQNGIHFWIHDSDYSDNKGAFRVKITEAE